jgi:hypothetical protein
VPKNTSGHTCEFRTYVTKGTARRSQRLCRWLFHKPSRNFLNGLGNLSRRVRIKKSQRYSKNARYSMGTSTSARTPRTLSKRDGCLRLRLRRGGVITSSAKISSRRRRIFAPPSNTSGAVGQLGHNFRPSRPIGQDHIGARLTCRMLKRKRPRSTLGLAEKPPSSKR